MYVQVSGDPADIGDAGEFVIGMEICTYWLRKFFDLCWNFFAAP